MGELTIRNWRITRGIPGGSHIWFDPKCERVKLYRIPSADGEGALSELEADLFATEGESGYLDRVASVSASGPGLAVDEKGDFKEFGLERLETELPLGGSQGGSSHG